MEMNKMRKYKMGHSDFTNPKVFGPGCWFSIHIQAKNAKTDELKRAFHNYMILLSRTLPCINCRDHLNDYMKNHPIKNFWQILDKDGNDIGLFKWSYFLHEAVNVRIGKKGVDWETALSMYSENTDMVCTADCGENNVSLVPSSPTSFPSKSSPATSFSPNTSFSPKTSPNTSFSPKSSPNTALSNIKSSQNDTTYSSLPNNIYSSSLRSSHTSSRPQNNFNRGARIVPYYT